MKKNLILAVCALCLPAGAALAAGGDGPAGGPPQTPNSAPPGFFVGTPEYEYQQSVDRYYHNAMPVVMPAPLALQDGAAASAQVADIAGTSQYAGQTPGSYKTSSVKPTR